jgi:3-hydroxyisobutyrate dehydrogenase
MSNITVLGQGAMGSRMADRLRLHGHAVTCWNRSGARMSPRQAVSDAAFVIAALRDDEASRDVWLDPETGALAGMAQAALAIESSTLSVGFVRELAWAMRGADRRFIDAPVLGSRPQAETGQLIHLIGGTEADVGLATPVLMAMGARQLHVGPAGSGAALKLIANTLFGIQVRAVAELIGRAPELGLDAAALVGLLAGTPLLSPAAKAAALMMLSGADDPAFPVALAAKDLRYAVGDSPAAMPVATAALHVIEHAQELGLGGRNLTAVARIYERSTVRAGPGQHQD